MLFDDDVMTNGQAKPSPFSGRLRSEERVKHLFLHIRRDASPIVPDCYFNTVAEAPRPGGKRWLIIAAVGFCSPLGRCVKSIGNQIEQNPCNVLREDIDLAGGRVQ